MTNKILDVIQLKDITKKYEDTWNIIKVGFGEENTRQKVLKEDGENTFKLRVFYPKNSLSPSSKFPRGGIGFYAAPIDIFPAFEVVFTYELYLDKWFKPQKGGKLPGIFISKPGANNMQGASGGNKDKFNASCRIMWRKNDMAEAYVYTPIKKQHEDYYNIPNSLIKSKYGDSLWRGIFNLKRNQWNFIRIHIKLNEVSKTKINQDGFLSIQINDTKQSFDKLIWRNNEESLCSALFINTFYGGNSKDYCCPNDTFIDFRNFRVDKII
jgi:hypothetical protein